MSALLVLSLFLIQEFGIPTVEPRAIPIQQVTWIQPRVSPTQAQSYFYSLRILEEGNPNPLLISLGNILCGGPVNAAECSTRLPAAAQSAIVTGNASQIRAVDGRNNEASPLSAPFIGNQGCIFRDSLYSLGARTTATTNKQNLNNVLNEFRKAKFKHISTNQTRGNQYVVTEECVGYIVSD